MYACIVDGSCTCSFWINGIEPVFHLVYIKCTHMFVLFCLFCRSCKLFWWGDSSISIVWWSCHCSRRFWRGEWWYTCTCMICWTIITVYWFWTVTGFGKTYFMRLCWFKLWATPITWLNCCFLDYISPEQTTISCLPSANRMLSIWVPVSLYKVFTFSHQLRHWLHEMEQCSDDATVAMETEVAQWLLMASASLFSLLLKFQTPHTM